MGSPHIKGYKDYIKSKMDYKNILVDLKNKKSLYQKILGDPKKQNTVKLNHIYDHRVGIDDNSADKFVNSLCDKLRKKEQKSYTLFDEETKKRRATKRAKILNYLLPEKISNTFKYLDFGCNDGSITNAVQEYFHFDPKNVYGVDIPEWNGIKSDCNLMNMFYIDMRNPKLPYADNFFDLITCFMVLHHNYNSNIPAIVKELKRVIKPGGYIVLSEHDMNNYTNKQVIDFHHLKYSCIEMDNINPDEYIGNYKSKKEWDRLFNMTIVSHTKPTGLLRGYYIAYNKPYSS